MEAYIISSIGALGFGYLVFLLFLKREKNFNFIRFYLLVSLGLGLCGPALEIDWSLNLPEVKNIGLSNHDKVLEPNEIPRQATIAVYESGGFDTSRILFSVYIAGLGIFLFRFGRNLYKILKQVVGSKVSSWGTLKIVEKKERGNPFSFFSYLFVHREDLEDPAFQKSVMFHEEAHSKQLHSLDVIISELVCCIFWFNPFTWLFKREIVENHEYLADSAVIQAGMDMEVYSYQIIKGGMHKIQPFISGFSFIKSKNRINMLYKEKSSSPMKFFKIGTALALLALVFTVSSFSTSHGSNAPFVVVVDAGHGGKDVGPLNEKEVNFQIAQQVKALNSTGNIEIVLVRENDKFLSLKDRLAFIQSQNADFLLSLHSNTSEDLSASGAEAYYAPGNDFHRESLQYSKIIVSKQVEQVTERGEVKSANFKILKESPVPGVLLEMGYLSNKVDAAKLRDPEHQKLIAKAILEGLQEISSVRN